MLGQFLDLLFLFQNGDTPLHSAAFNGQADCMRILIEHDAYVNSQDNVSDTNYLISLSWVGTQ